MEIVTNHEEKLVEVWLTQAEQSNQKVMASLEPVYQTATEKKYMVALFRSGNRPLAAQTSDLLCYNRKLPTGDMGIL